MGSEQTNPSSYASIRWIHRSGLRRPLVACFALAAAGLAGCNSAGPVASPSVAAVAPVAAPILEGDTLRISFTGAANLDTTQDVRRDGRISLAFVGEVVAAGRTPEELSADLTGRYSSELLSSEVVVTVVASAFNVSVSGAVLNPGKYTSKRPLTALEAVMEAGGFDQSKANMKKVVVVRHENGKVANFVLDLSSALNGEPSEPFYLKPSDIVFVPARFVWF